MQINQVRFKNLNSLSGEWVINFRDPEFDAAGIFALVGPTGSGKTTILDALTLALYGKTSRLGAVTKNDNHIMTQGQGQCFAEVEFLYGGEEYRVMWSQHRAKGKADGPLQAPKHEIAYVTTGTIVEEKPSRVAPKIEEITGLDFPRFTRSVLLPQGQFASFLSAKEDEKSPILEKITGTKIYSIISQRVFEKAKEETGRMKELQARLEAVTILDPGTLAELHAAQKNIFAELTNIDQEIKGTTALLHRKKNYNDICEKITTIEKDIEKLTLTRAGLHQEKTRIDQARTAQQYYGDYCALQELRNTKKVLAQKIENQNKHNGELYTKIENTEKQLEQLVLEVENLTLDVEAKQRSAHHIHELEVKIDSIHEEKAAILAELELLNNTRRKLIATKTEKTRGLNKLGSELARNRQTYLDLQSQSHIFPALDNIEQWVQELQSQHNKTIMYEQEINNINTQLAALHKKHKRLQKSINTKELEIKELHNSRKDNELVKSENTHKNPLEELDKIIKNISTLEKEIPTINIIKNNLENIFELTGLIIAKNTENATAGNEHASLSDELELKNKALQKLRLQQEKLDKKLAEHEEQRIIDQLQATLSEGEACKVCGSLQHNIKPKSKRRSTSAATINKFNKQRDELEKESTILLEDIQKTRFTISAHSNEIKKIVEQSKKLQEQFHTSVIESDNIIKNIPADNPRIIKYNQILSLSQEYKNFFTSTAPGLDSLHNKIAHLIEDCFDEAATTIADLTIHKNMTIDFLKSEQEYALSLQEKQDKLNTILHDIKLIENELKDFTHNKDIIESKLSYCHDTMLTADNYLTTFFPNVNAANLSEKIISYVNKISEYKDNKNKSETINHDIQLLDKKILELNAVINKLDNEIDNADALSETLKSRNKAYIEKENELRGNIQAIFPEGDIDQKLAEAKTHLSSTTQKLADQRISYATLTENLEHSKILCEEYEENYSEITQLEHDKNLSFVHQREKLGFASEEDFVAALLDPEIIENFYLTWENMSRNLATSEAQLGILRDQQQSFADDDMSIEVPAYELMLENLQHRHYQLSHQRGALGQQIEHNRANLMLKNELENQLATLGEASLIWHKLNELIGSKDGKAYRNFAQSVTFDVLITIANEQLQAITDRFILLQDSTKQLELSVMDTYLASEIRTTKNLSGGESFLVSLALALALASMMDNSGMKHNSSINSLFLDEGFGTLDEISLDQALDALTLLHSQGKRIGIISHIAALQDRLGAHITVTPRGNGFSTLTGPGCSRIS